MLNFSARINRKGLEIYCWAPNNYQQLYIYVYYFFAVVVVVKYCYPLHLKKALQSGAGAT